MIVGPLRGDWWKLLSSPFAYLNGLYAFIALLATAIFGWLLERRRGPAIVLAVFFGGSVTGALAASAVYTGADRQRRQRGARWRCSPPGRSPTCGRRAAATTTRAICSASAAIAALLLVLPYARPEASWLAGVVGALVGLVAGLGAVDLVDSPR